MDGWGCEFIGEDRVGIQPPLEPEEDRVFEIPMALMSELVDKRYQKEMRIREKDRLQALTVNIARHGILNPGIVHYSDQLIRLYDGNHRYHCAKELGFKTFPVTFAHVPTMQNKTGTSLLFAFDFLLSELRKS